MTRIFFSAGESSGDTHGSHLIEALRAQDPTIECEGLGGRGMEAAGMTLRYDLAETAIMGFTEVVKSLWFIRKLFRETVSRLRATRPDTLVLIDYPGFNLRLAAEAHKLGIPVVYYISPQVWAWKRDRVKTIGRLVRKMLVILPFEETLYKDAGVDCAYVGHPLFDHIASVHLTGRLKNGLVIGLMPGSREQEISRHYPVMVEVARGILEKHPDARFVTPCVDEARRDQIHRVAGDFPVDVTIGDTYELLHAAHFCVVASGTATVETALFEVPMVVMYKMSTLTYWLARLLVDVRAIAMVNILSGKHVVPEFIQHRATPERILPVALELIDDSPARRIMRTELAKIRGLLGGEGASENAAREILAIAKSTES